ALDAVPLQYQEAFRTAGLNVEDTEDLAAKVRTSAIREHLVAALDDWAFQTRDEDARGNLLRAARLADPHPWRDQLRDPAVWHDPVALNRLAEEAAVAEQSPQLLTILSRGLREAQIDAVPLLRAAHRHYPTDFWILFELGNVLAPEKPAEAI